MANILSIDFDFFPIAEEYTILEHYPDPIDLPTNCSTQVWAIHYAHWEGNEKLLEIAVYWEKIDEIKDIIYDSQKAIGYITNSHKHLYDAIKDRYDTEEKIHIYNLDMHHDLFNDNEKVDCGNWAKYVLEEYPKATLTWIANPLSKKMYGLEEPEFNIIEEDLNCLHGLEWDLIYLCRSDNWTPPHLDDAFLKLSGAMLDCCFPCLGEREVLEPRYNDSFIKRVEEIQKENETTIGKQYRVINKIKD